MAARGRPTTRRVEANPLWHHLTTRAGTLPVQAKLEVGSVHDREEEEADRLFETVMRKPLRDGQAEERTASGTFGKHGVPSPRGGALGKSVRLDFERRFGHDFGRVRVHSGAVAAESARDLGARAYTIGSDIVFGPGQYEPGTQEGSSWPTS